MSGSDDDSSIPILPSARKPGYEPPIEYVQYLDMGGELAKLISLKEQKSLKAAAKTLKARTMAELYHMRYTVLVYRYCYNYRLVYR